MFQKFYSDKYTLHNCLHKRKLNKPIIKSYSVPAFLFGQKIRAKANKRVTYEQQVWLVFNSEEDQYSPACSAELCKGKTFILWHIFTETVQFYQVGQKGKKKSLSNRWSFRQYSNLPIKSFKTARPVQQCQEKIKYWLLQWNCNALFLHLQNDFSRDKIHLWT